MDEPFHLVYREIMAAFPEAKFIYTIRDPESWFASYDKLMAEMIAADQTGKRRLFLVAAIEVSFDQDGWAPLCKFLQKPIPPLPFPHDDGVGEWYDEHFNDNGTSLVQSAAARRPARRSAHADAERSELAELTSTSSETELTQAPEEDVTSTHTSETGSGEISQDPIDFRAIAFPIAAEFGDEVAEGLRSSKWDRRQRALQSISSALNGGHLWSCGPFRERRGAWRVSCQVLNHVLKDKVIPVKLAALQLFRDQRVQHALDVLIGPVMSCLGDSNVRLHESAQSNLVFARYLLGDKLLHRLRAFLEPKRAADRPCIVRSIVRSASAEGVASAVWKFHDSRLRVTPTTGGGASRPHDTLWLASMTRYRRHVASKLSQSPTEPL
eukprot:g31005.t1